MPRLNRIAAFVSVTFVLVFLTKINKVGLYTAYFKTIADVEVRNSQDLEASGLEYLAAHTAPAAPAAQAHADGPAAEAAVLPVAPESPEATAPRFATSDYRYINPFHFFVQSAPRAPGA